MLQLVQNEAWHCPVEMGKEFLGKVVVLTAAYVSPKFHHKLPHQWDLYIYADHSYNLYNSIENQAKNVLEKKNKKVQCHCTKRTLWPSICPPILAPNLSVDSPLQVTPQISIWIQVWALAGPFHNFNLLLVKPFFCWFGCILWIVVMLKGKIPLHLQLFSRRLKVLWQFTDICLTAWHFNSGV